MTISVCMQLEYWKLALLECAFCALTIHLRPSSWQDCLEHFSLMSCRSLTRLSILSFLAFLFCWMLLIMLSMPTCASSNLLSSAFFMFSSIASAAFTRRQFSITSTFSLIQAISSLGLMRVSERLLAPAICCPCTPLAPRMPSQTTCSLPTSPTSPSILGTVSSKTQSLEISDMSWVSLMRYSPSPIFCHLSPQTLLILTPPTIPWAMQRTLTTTSLATSEMMPPRALQKASSRVLSSLMKQKAPSFRVQILFIRSSSWSVPKPKLWMLNTPSSLFSCLASACLRDSSAPLSWPSESRKTEVTLLGTLRSLMVLRASSMPLMMLVPPDAKRELMWLEKTTRFSWVTALRPQTLLPLLLKVMMERRSEGVSVSMRNFMVSRTSSIFSPLIDPLTSITQIRSTLVLAPPVERMEHMAGNTVTSPSFTCDRCAFSSISTFPSLPTSFTLSRNFSSSLKIPGISSTLRCWLTRLPQYPTLFGTLWTVTPGWTMFIWTGYCICCCTGNCRGACTCCTGTCTLDWKPCC